MSREHTGRVLCSEDAAYRENARAITLQFRVEVDKGTVDGTVHTMAPPDACFMSFICSARMLLISSPVLIFTGHFS
jgi:hypothetical protein